AWPDGRARQHAGARLRHADAGTDAEARREDAGRSAAGRSRIAAHHAGPGAEIPWAARSRRPETASRFPRIAEAEMSGRHPEVAALLRGPRRATAPLRPIILRGSPKRASTSG